MATKSTEESRRPYELGKRLEQMEESRAAILRAARSQLEANGYRQMTMGSLAAESGVTRQTIHNLFGTKAGVLEALFDLIALDGGMESMRNVMTQPSTEAMLEGFVEVFCRFWSSNRMLLRRIHGIGAIDPEFGTVIEARNGRRYGAARRIVSRMGGGDLDGTGFNANRTDLIRVFRCTGGQSSRREARRSRRTGSGSKDARMRAT